MKNILVLGSSGMAGSMISNYLGRYHNVTSWDRSKFNPLIDSLNKDLSAYDYVINCIGVIKQRNVKIDEMYYLNGKFPHELSVRTNKLIHISSDCVFSGLLGCRDSYSSKDIPKPTDDYGKSKLEGECSSSAMVLRTSIIGPAKDNLGLFEWLRNNKDLDVNGFINHWWSGVTTLELAKIINSLINKEDYSYGLFQISSEKISKYELLNLINLSFNLKKQIIAYYDINYVNRSLIPDINSAPIKEQIQELFEFIK